MDLPKKYMKYWWVVLVAVPIVLAMIAILPDLIPKPQGGGVNGQGEVYTVNFEAGDIQGDVAFNNVELVINQAQTMAGESLPEGAEETLRQATDLILSGKYDEAIPLLESVAEEASAPALYNNLGAAYLAAGDQERALSYFARASNDETAQDNLSLIGPTQPTIDDHVLALLTRFEDTGGLITLEVIYAHTGTETVSRFCMYPSGGYLLDESTATKWWPVDSGGALCSELEPGDTHLTWAKFQIDDPLPEQFTAVIDQVPRPFERLALRNSSE